VKPAVRRWIVRYLGEEWAMSERRACGLAVVCRSTVRYQAHGEDDESVRTRLRELAALRKRFGYRRLGVLLRREGVLVNHKRVYRLYREEGLSLRRRKRKRLTAEGRGPGELASGPDQVWSLDFVSDCTATSRRLKLLTVVDTYTRESLAIEVDTSISGERVARVLDRVIGERGAQPDAIVMDN
jgi:putative transposase